LFINTTIDTPLQMNHYAIQHKTYPKLAASRTRDHGVSATTAAVYFNGISLCLMSLRVRLILSQC